MTGRQSGVVEAGSHQSVPPQIRTVGEGEGVRPDADLGMGETDLFPRIVPWVGFGSPVCHLGWAKGPGVSRPSSRFGGADNKRGVPAAGSDGAHLLVCLRFGRHKAHHHRHRLPSSLTVMALLSSIDMRMSWSERGVELSLGSSAKTALCVPSSTRCAKEHTVRPGSGRSESPPLFFSRNFA